MLGQVKISAHMSAVIPSISFRISKDFWGGQRDPSKIDRAVYANRKYPDFDESLIVLKASREALEALKKSKNKITAAFENGIESGLDNLQKARNQVPDAILNFRYHVGYFHYFVKNQNEIFYDMRKIRADGTYCASVLQVGNIYTAEVCNFYDKVAATLQETNGKTFPIFQEFHEAVVHGFEKNYNESTSTLQMVDNEVVFMGEKINKLTTACKKTRHKAIATKEISCKALDALQKSQDEITASFNKIQELSININKATNEARASVLNSTNESTVRAAFQAVLNKVKPEFSCFRDIEDKLVADLWRGDGVLASFLKIQDESIAATESLKDQVEALASLIEFEEETTSLLSSKWQF